MKKNVYKKMSAFIQKAFLTVALLQGIGVNAQIINTVAGNDTAGYSGDGNAATAAELNSPYGVAVDASGNMYIADGYNNVVRKVTATGIISTFAGNGNFGYSGDNGPATAAQLNLPFSIAIDAAGNVYISDQGNSCIRKVNTSGVITTVAGNGSAGYSGDGGPANGAVLYNPAGIAFDAAGNLYIADYGNNVVRKITSGFISTVAGDGQGDFFGDQGPATAAYLHNPIAVAVDAAGDLYIADYGNNAVRKVNASGIISTVAGIPLGTSNIGITGGAPATFVAITPSGLAFDASGNLFISDGSTSIMEVTASGTINTVVGNADSYYSNGALGDGGPAIAGFLSESIYGITFDASGNLYIADQGNNLIRKVSGPFPTPCNTVPTITIANTTTTGATITWNAISGVAGYEVLVDNNPYCNASLGIFTTDTSYTINNLSPGVAYSAHVRDSCGPGSASAWSTSGYIVAATCGVTDITASNITQTSAVISWSSPGTEGYNVVIDQSSANPTVLGTATTDTVYTANGLTPGAIYYAHVRDSCGPYYNGTSWSASAFTTVACYAIPTVTIAEGSDTLLACAGTTLHAVSAIGTAFQWQSYDTAIAGATAATYTVSEGGRYAVIAYKTDTSGCASNPSAKIFVLTGGQSLAAPAGATNICAGGSVTLNALTGAGYTYQWLQNGALIGGANGASYTATTAGSYNAIINNGTCADTAYRINIKVRPVPASTLTTTSYCQSGTLQVGLAGPMDSITWMRNGNVIQTYKGIWDANAIRLIAPGPEQLGGVEGIQMDSSDNLYLSSSNNVQMWAPGAPVGAIVAGGNGFGGDMDQIESANGIFLTPNNDLYIADYYNYRIAKWSLGSSTGVLVAPLNWTPSNNGNYEVNMPFDVCVDDSLNVYASGYDQGVKKFTPGDSTAATFGGTVVAGGSDQTGSAANQLTFPSGIGVDNSTGDIYILDGVYNELRVQKWPHGATEGLTVASVPVYGNYSNGFLHEDGSGNIYFSYNSPFGTNAGVVKWQQNVASSTIIAGGNGIGTASNQFAYTAGLAFDKNNNMYVSDRDNYRIQKFNYRITDTLAAPGPGTYIVNINPVGYGCAIMDTIIINPLPAPVIVENGATLSTGAFATYQWYMNNQPITGATSQQYTFTQNGIYKVYVTDSSGCADTSAPYMSNLAVANVNGSDAINIYPNPASNLVYVTAPYGVNITLFGLDGKMVLQQKSANVIDMTNLADGVYTIKITDKEDITKKIEKLVKLSK